MFAFHKHRRKAQNCPNCGTFLEEEDNFCRKCGQENHDLKVPIHHLVYEFIESIFHFDIKLWTTLKSILTQPGQLTKDFNMGKRVRYVHPTRFYVFVSFVLFLLVSMTKSKDSNENIKEKEKINIETNINAKSKDTNNNESNGIGINLGGDEKEVKSPIDVKSIEYDSIELEPYMVLENNSKIYPELGKRLYFEKEVLDSLWTKHHNENYFLSLTNKKLFKFQLVEKLFSETERELIYEEYYHNGIKYVSYLMFIFMPLIAFLLLIIYYFNRKFYYEHLIFSIHIHTIIFLFLIITILLSMIPYIKLICWTAFILISSLYIIKALKNLYEQSYFKTILKFLLINFIYLFLFTICLIGIVVYTI